MPVLGVVLLFEAVALMMLVRDIASDRSASWVAFVVAAAVVGLPYGYVVGMVVGTLLSLAQRRGWLGTPRLGATGTSAPGD
jgi:NhaP-type Na+/H+ or K+/H+ antiporter